MARPYACMLVVMLLLSAGLTSEAIPSARPGFGSLLDTAVNYLLDRMMPGLSKVQPAVYRVIDGLVKKRVKRNDHQGASRLAALRPWFSLVGLQKGVPVIMLQLLRQREHLQDVWSRIAATTDKFQQRMRGVDVMQAWQDLQPDINEAVRSVGALLSTMTHGPVGRFLEDLKHAIDDKFFVQDVLEVVAPTVQKQGALLPSITQLYRAVRSALDQIEQLVPEGQRRRREGVSEEL